MGYAQQSGIPYGDGLAKNRYVGRTFIQPNQGMREVGVRTKLNAMTRNVRGKRIVLVDDSIVRGTTSRRIVEMLRTAGAREVHVRVSSPMVLNACYFGIDIATSQELIGHGHSAEDICKFIGADSYPGITVKNTDVYYEYVDGMDKKLFAEAAKSVSNMKGEDRDGDGKSDAYSAMDKKFAYINSLPLNAEEKTRLAEALIGTDGKLSAAAYKRLPWK